MFCYVAMSAGRQTTLDQLRTRQPDREPRTVELRQHHQRFPSFATGERERRPARAAVWCIPCLILCLADVERTSMVRRKPVLTSPARRRPPPSSTVPLRPRASEPSHSAPAASHRFPGPCGPLPRNRLETPTPSLFHRRCGVSKFRHQREPPTRWPQSASQLLVDPMTSWSAISAGYSMARRFMTRGTGRTQVSLLQ